MIQDRSSTHSSALAPDEDIEFEPTLSAEMARVVGAVERDEDGEYVRDDELLLNDPSSFSQGPMQELLQRESASGYSPFSGERLATSSFEHPRRSGPPPLTPPPMPRNTELRVKSSFEDARRTEQVVTSVPLASLANQGPEPATTVHRRSSPPPLVSEAARRSSAPPPMSGNQTLERRRVRKEIIREGDILLGKLRIDRVVAEGLIVTAEAIHVHLGARYLVVLLSPLGHGFSIAQDHFIRTARAVALMQSEHIAKVTEIGVLESGAPFLVVEMSGSSDLAEVLRVRGPMGVTDAVEFAIQIAEALAEAHSQGVIHGSLRPSCLRIADGMDGWPSVKVLGFGTMAQWFLNTSSLRNLGRRTVGGTLPYLSPEQIRSPSDLDTRTDIWSLGALLYEMLVACPLYQSDAPAALLAMIAADPPPAVSAVRADVPRVLESVILRCLQKDRTSRFATVADLARALQPFAPPASHASVERIIRVMARGASGAAPNGRGNSALVHVRGTGGNFRSEPKPHEKSSTTLPIGWVAGGVVVLGALAGILGATLTAQALKVPSQSPGPVEIRPEPNVQTEVYAARPASPLSAVGQDPGSATSPALVASTASHTIAVPAAPAPVSASPAVAAPTIATPAPTVNVQPARPMGAAQTPRRPATQATSVAALAKEVRSEKPESPPVKKAASDLFSDMK